MTDVYILKNRMNAYGVLEIDHNFDIMKLSDFTLEEAVSYLAENNIDFRLRTGVKGTLYFKSNEVNK